MRPTHTEVFELESFNALQQRYGVMPTGELLIIGCNPYNGNVVVNYQNSEKAIAVISSIFRQLVRDNQTNVLRFEELQMSYHKTISGKDDYHAVVHDMYDGCLLLVYDGVNLIDAQLLPMSDLVLPYLKRHFADAFMLEVA